MKKTPLKRLNLDYLHNSPKTIYWKVVAPKGARLSVLQDHDVVFDEYDRKIRKLI